MATASKKSKKQSVTKVKPESLLLKNLPFVLFVTALLVLYIANAHSAEKKIRQMQVAEKEVKALRWEYMSSVSEFNQTTMRSAIVKSASEIDLSVPRQQVKKIVVPKK